MAQPCSTEIPRKWGALCQADPPGQVPAGAAAVPGWWGDNQLGFIAKIKLIHFLRNPSKLVPKALSLSLCFIGVERLDPSYHPRSAPASLFPTFLFQSWEIPGLCFLPPAVHCRSQKTHRREDHYLCFHHQVEPEFGLFYGIGPVAFTSGVPGVCSWQVQPVLQLRALGRQGNEPLGSSYSSAYCFMNGDDFLEVGCPFWPFFFPLPADCTCWEAEVRPGSVKSQTLRVFLRLKPCLLSVTTWWEMLNTETFGFFPRNPKTLCSCAQSIS